MITFRATALLLLAAPLIVAGYWLPGMPWVAVGYVALIGVGVWLDRRAADSAESRFEVERIHDSRLSLGADNRIQLQIRNRSGQPASVRVRDEPPDAWVDGAVVLAETIAPRQTWTGRYTVHPLRRGDYAFGDVTLRWAGPFNLYLRQATVPLAAPVKVYPNLLDVRRYDLLLRQNRLQELGLRTARSLGEGTEYERLREYLPDDDFRRINWKATARRFRPITTEYQTERSQNIMAVIDIGRMMQSPVAQIAKLDYVINAALLLGYVATGMGDKVGLMTFADQTHQFLAPRQGRGQFYRMLELLYAVEAQPVEPDFEQALAYLALKQRRRALTVIFTDLSGGMPVQSLVAHASILARRSLPLVVTISDPDVVAAAQQVPEDSLGVYQQVTAQRLMDERRTALEGLRRQGVLTLDVPANQLSLAVIQRYLSLKGKMML